MVSAGIPWHERIWVVIAALVVFWPLGIFLLWRLPTFRRGPKWALFGTAVVVWFVQLAIIGAATGGGDKEETDSVAAIQATATAIPTATASETVIAQPTPAPTPTPTPTPEPTPTLEPTPAPTSEARPTPTPEPSWETGPVTEETVMAALKDIDEKMIRSDIKGKVKYARILDLTGLNDAESPRVVVGFKPGTVLSETDFLTVAGASSVDAAALLFENPAVGSVLIEALADMTDAYGNKSEDILTRVWLSRATAEKISWDGLRDLQLLDNKHIFCIADDHFIHPTIYQKLKDKGCLLG